MAKNLENKTKKSGLRRLGESLLIGIPISIALCTPMINIVSYFATKNMINNVVPTQTLKEKYANTIKDNYNKGVMSKIYFFGDNLAAKQYLKDKK